MDRIVLAYSLIGSLLQRALKRTKLELACRNGDLELFVELRNIPACIPGWLLRYLGTRTDTEVPLYRWGAAGERVENLEEWQNIMHCRHCAIRKRDSDEWLCGICSIE